MTDKTVMVACRPRELRPGMVAEAFSARDGGWGHYEIEKVEKRPGRRERGLEPVPTRYWVWYKGIPGRRTLTPTATVTITAASYYKITEDQTRAGSS
jgi:hypothetical protein